MKMFTHIPYSRWDKYSETRLIRTPRGHAIVSVLTGVRIKRVNFRENIWAFCRDKRNCPYKACVRRAGFRCMAKQDKKAQKQRPRLTTIVWRFSCRPFCKNNTCALIVAAAKLIALHLFFGTVPWLPPQGFAPKAKFRGGTLVTRAYKESTYSWNIQSYSQYREKLDLLEQGPRGIGRQWWRFYCLRPQVRNG